MRREKRHERRMQRVSGSDILRREKRERKTRERERETYVERERERGRDAEEGGNSDLCFLSQAMT